MLAGHTSIALRPHTRFAATPRSHALATHTPQPARIETPTANSMVSKPALLLGLLGVNSRQSRHNIDHHGNR
jgi:hypothetical protein